MPEGRERFGVGSIPTEIDAMSRKDRGILVVTHEGLTTMTQSSRTGWTIMSGTWNHLRQVWGPTPNTLAKIQVSCKTQESLEEANVFSPTRHLLLAIKRLWQIDRVHDLPAVAVPVFFPSVSKGNEWWWGTQDLNAVFLWDTMDS